MNSCHICSVCDNSCVRRRVQALRHVRWLEGFWGGCLVHNMSHRLNWHTWDNLCVSPACLCTRLVGVLSVRRGGCPAEQRICSHAIDLGIQATGRWCTASCRATWVRLRSQVEAAHDG